MNEKKNGLELVVIFLSILLTLSVGYIIIDKVFIKNGSNNDSKLLDLDKFGKYINYDNTYSSMEEIQFEDRNNGMIYPLSLGMDGKVFFNIFGSTTYIENITDGIDIIGLRVGLDEFNNNKWYILNDRGDVFEYTVDDMIKGKKEATLIDDVKNVDRLIEFHHSASENSNVTWGILAILENGNVVQLESSGM